MDAVSQESAGNTVAPSSIRLPSLTSVRWFAASTVFLRHGGLLLTGTPIAASYAVISPQGATGVSFFFILSGFVLAWTYRSGEASRGFYRRRIARVVPAYLVAVALGLVYIALFPSSKSFLAAVFPATLLQSWVPNPHIYLGNSAVLWSLSTEAFFYASFPFLIVPVMRLDRRGLVRLIIVAATISLVVPLLLHPDKESGFGFWMIYIAPIYRLMEFIIGLCLCGLLLRGVRLRLPLRVTVVVAIVCYALAGQVPIYAMWVAVTLIPFALLIFSLAEADLAGRVTILHHPALLALGAWSFSFYLLHTLVIHAAVKVATRSPSTAWHVALWLGSYLGGIVAAYLLYRLVEHPLERRIRPGVRPRR